VEKKAVLSAFQVQGTQTDSLVVQAWIAAVKERKGFHHNNQAADVVVQLDWDRPVHHTLFVLQWGQHMVEMIVSGSEAMWKLGMLQPADEVCYLLMESSCWTKCWTA
jgi:hypothetical protein